MTEEHEPHWQNQGCAHHQGLQTRHLAEQHLLAGGPGTPLLVPALYLALPQPLLALPQALLPVRVAVQGALIMSAQARRQQRQLLVPRRTAEALYLSQWADGWPDALPLCTACKHRAGFEPDHLQQNGLHARFMSSHHLEDIMVTHLDYTHHPAALHWPRSMAVVPEKVGSSQMQFRCASTGGRPQDGRVEHCRAHGDACLWWRPLKTIC